MILLKIYIICTVLALLFMLLVITNIRKLAETGEHPHLQVVMDLFTNAPKYYHFIAVFMPVLNIVFAVLALLTIVKMIRHYIFMARIKLGWKLVKRFSRKAYKHTVIKSFILNTFFPRPCLKMYLLALKTDKELWEHTLNLLKQITDEKTECQSECDPIADTKPSDQEAPIEREENKPFGSPL